MNTLTLKRWLEDHKHSQNWLARELGITAAYMSQLINGKRSASLAVAIRVERLTGVKPQTLIRNGDRNGTAA